VAWKCEEIPDHALPPAADRQVFDLHLAALDWSLIDPIIINDADDIKSRNWRDRGFEPFEHQIQNLITFCRRLPVALVADDVGLGKTISAGLILSELIARRRVSRALVICPKVLAPQWVAELDEKFGLTAKDVTGAALNDELRRSTPVVGICLAGAE
jgi:SNF2 family DNA or RNA helicase